MATAKGKIAVASLVSLTVVLGASYGTVGSAATGSGNSGKYPATMTYWVYRDQTGTDTNYSQLGLYQELQKWTGTQVTFHHPAIVTSGTDPQFSLLMASKNLPDVIQYDWLTANPDLMIKEGKILRLNEIIKRDAPDLWNIIQSHPEIKKELTSANGNIYCFPELDLDLTTRVYNGPAIRKDWLDKLHLPMPTTIADWEKDLTAIKNNASKLNASKPVYPFLYQKGDIESMNSFIGAYGITFGFYQKNGKVSFGPATPAFKAFLTTMHRWYQNGLIDPDYVTTSYTQMQALVSSDQLGATTAWLGGGIGYFMNLMKKTEPSFNYVGTVYPSLQKGQKGVGFIQTAFNGYGVAISTSAKDPDAIAKWLNIGYTQKGALLYNFGPQGKTWSYVNGRPTFNSYVTHNPQGLTMQQVIANNSSALSSGPFLYDARVTDAMDSLPQQLTARKNWSASDTSILMPPVNLTLQEQKDSQQPMTDISTYVDTWADKFITGSQPLSKFNDYLQGLNKLGLGKMMQIQQAALNRWNSSN